MWCAGKINLNKECCILDQFVCEKCRKWMCYFALLYKVVVFAQVLCGGVFVSDFVTQK